MSDPQFAGALHDVERADDVGVDIGAGVFKAVANTGLRGQMDDCFGLDLANVFHQQISFLKPKFARRKAVRLRRQHSVALFLDAHVIIVGHRIETENFEPFFEEKFAKMEADEAGATRYEYFSHNSILPNLDCRGP